MAKGGVPLLRESMCHTLCRLCRACPQKALETPLVKVLLVFDSVQQLLLGASIQQQLMNQTPQKFKRGIPPLDALHATARLPCSIPENLLREDEVELGATDFLDTHFVALGRILDVEQAAVHHALQLKDAMVAVRRPQDVISMENPTLKVRNRVFSNPAHCPLPLPLLGHGPQLVVKVGLAALILSHLEKCHTPLNANERCCYRQQCTLVALVSRHIVHLDHPLNHPLIEIHECCRLLREWCKNFGLEQQLKHVISSHSAPKFLGSFIHRVHKSCESPLLVPPVRPFRHLLPLLVRCDTAMCLGNLFLEPLGDAAKVLSQSGR
mmetsp:Transcript_12115/g.30346  ORF Transcript_12115/g.30346 Transcript_12115/m.30346 type:complete len:323 (-) Transcript_12115:1305-2273(-)